MSTLRTATIRLAYENPELRSVLLPLLKTGAGARPFGPNGPSFSVVPQREITALGTRLTALFEQAVKQFQSEYEEKDSAPPGFFGVGASWSDLQEDMSEQRFPTALVEAAFTAMFPGGVMDEMTRKPVGWGFVPRSVRSFPKVHAAYVQKAQKDPKVLALVKAIHAAYMGTP